MRDSVNCILTINDDDNFGNRLQNCALQELLRPYGDVTTVLIGTDRGHQLVRRVKQICKDILEIPRLGKMGVSRLRRHLAFYRFTSVFVPNTHVSMSDQGVVRTSRTVGKVCIGSDQVWNYSFAWLAPTLKYRLGASFESGQLLSYAASLGVSSVDEEYQPIFQEYLSRIPRISVREIAAQQALQPFVKQPITVVLDPTLMIDDEYWHKIAARNKTKGKYVLTYFLGEVSTQQKNEMQAYADTHGCTIKRLNDVTDVETYSAGPREFVSLFKDASYVFTDSYHACCFSLIFGKNFKVYSRNGGALRNMNSRMATLFTLLDLDEALLEKDSRYPAYDYDVIRPKLLGLQRQSEQWLRESMRS